MYVVLEIQGGSNFKVVFLKMTKNMICVSGNKTMECVHRAWPGIKTQVKLSEIAILVTHYCLSTTYYVLQICNQQYQKRETMWCYRLHFMDITRQLFNWFDLCREHYYKKKLSMLRWNTSVASCPHADYNDIW